MSGGGAQVPERETVSGFSSGSSLWRVSVPVQGAHAPDGAKRNVRVSRRPGSMSRGGAPAARLKPEPATFAAASSRTPLPVLLTSIVPWVACPTYTKPKSNSVALTAISGSTPALRATGTGTRASSGSLLRIETVSRYAPGGTPSVLKLSCTGSEPPGGTTPDVGWMPRNGTNGWSWTASELWM